MPALYPFSKVAHATALVFASQVLSVAAQQTGIITVTGSMDPPGCNIALSDGVVDYGVMTVGQLRDSGVNQLGSRTMNARLTCSKGTQIAITVSDNNASSAQPGVTPVIEQGFADNTDVYSTVYPHAFFGLGFTSGHVPIGNYTLAITTLDHQGQLLEIIRSVNNGLTWGSDVKAYASDDAFLSFASPGTISRYYISSLNFSLKITAAIQSTKALNLGKDSVDLMGSATVTLVYL